MIIPIRYQGRSTQKTPDGKTVSVPVPPKLILQHQGPVLQVVIEQPKAVADKLRAEGKAVIALPVTALVDTGARSCVITPRIAEQLGLVQTGFQNVQSVQDSQKRPQYFGRMVMPWGRALDLPLVACPLPGQGKIECLIGRDVLQYWHLTYNGADGSITICD